MRFLLILNTLAILCSYKLVSGSKEYSKFIDELFKDYDKGVRPNHGSVPVTVGISMYILALTEVDEKDMTFTVSFYYREKWEDPRLAFKPSPTIGLDDNSGFIQLAGPRVDNIWTPDTFIVNEVRSFQHRFIDLNTFVRISQNGQILKSSRYTLTASAIMDLSSFPFDEQALTLELESYGHTTKTLRYKWENEHQSVGIDASFSTPKYAVLGHRVRNMESNLASGNYSRMTLDLFVKRASGRYIIRFFLPMITFVTVSLASLWSLEPKICAFVNILNIILINIFMGEMGSELPGVSYATAIDTYFVISLFWIFLCLLFSLLSLYVNSIPKNGNEEIEMSHRDGIHDDVETLVGQRTQPSNSINQKLIRIFKSLEILVKISIMGLFGVVTLIFWISYSQSRNLLTDKLFDDFILANNYTN